MRRLPVYVFEDLNSVGIYKVPLESMVQINDSDGNGTPVVIQLLSKEGLTPSSTINDLLQNDNNFANTTEDTEIPSELEKVQEEGKIGWRILGRDSLKYAPIGQDAIDLSVSDYSGDDTSPYGASGNNSFAVGFDVQASGELSSAFGQYTIAANKASVAFGQYNLGKIDTIYEVGIGTDEISRKNALEIYKDGRVIVPEISIETIEDSFDNRIIITKEFLDQELSKKLNLNGGIISGNLEIAGDVQIDTDLIVNGSSTLPEITGDTNFGGNITINNTLTVNERLTTSKEIFISNFNNKSSILFEEPSTSDVVPAIYWSSNLPAEFKVDTLQSVGNTLWHSGNFNPDDKFNTVGGTITGDVNIDGDLVLGGELVVNTINDNLNILGDLAIDGSLYATWDIQTSAKLILGLDENSNSTLVFKDNSVDATPKLYWNNSTKEFAIDTTSGIGYTLWHSGIFDPNTKINVFEKGQANGVATLDENGIVTETQLPQPAVTSINNHGYYIDGNSDIILTTDDINEGGTNLYYTDARADARVQAAIDDNAGSGDTTKLWSADKITTELSNKFDKIGGTVTGDVTLAQNLIVQGSTEFAGDLDISANGTVNGDLYLNGSASIEGNIYLKGSQELGGKIAIGLDANNDSRIDFIDAEDLNQNFIPSLYWKSDANEFRVDTSNSTGAILWHSGNFIPGSKLDVAGGTITGDLTVNGDFSIGGSFVTSTNFTENITAEKDIDVWGLLKANFALRIGADISNNSNIFFTDIDSGDVSLYWDNSAKEFRVDTDTGSGFTIYHSGNVSSLVTSVNSQTGDVVLTTTDISEGDNLYYTDARVDSRIQLSSINALVDVYVDGVQNGQILKYNEDTDRWEAGDDIHLVDSVNGQTGNVTLTTDDINEGSTNLYYTDARADARVQAAIDDNAGSGDTTKLWSADKITTELSGKYDKTGGTIDGNVTITGSLVINTDIDIQGIASIDHISTDIQFDGTIDSFGRIYTHEEVDAGTYLRLGILDASQSKIIFTDSDDTTATPSLYWDNTNKTFKVDTNAAQGFEIWTTGNFNPDTKLNVDGGTISGDLDISGILTTQDDVHVAGDLYIGSILSDLTITGNVTTTQNLTISQQVEVGDTIKVGINNSGSSANSSIIFTDSDDATATPNINWDNTNKIFAVDTTSGTGYTLWHSGTFDPNTKINISEKGQANGVATLDSSGKLPTSQLPALAITDVYVVGTISDRDNLTVETGDICKVTDSDGSGHPQTYIWDGSQWIDIQETSDVISVNGQTGNVTLTTDDINEGSTNLYYTDARADARVQAAIDDNAGSGDTTKLWSADKTYTSINTAVTTIPINQLTDVDTTTTAPNDGDRLTWDATNSLWIPSPIYIPTFGKQNFTGDGTTTDFTINGKVFTRDQMDAYIDGTLTLDDDSVYTVSDNGTDTTVSFSTAPANGSWVRISYYI